MSKFRMLKYNLALKKASAHYISQKDNEADINDKVYTHFPTEVFGLSVTGGDTDPTESEAFYLASTIFGFGQSDPPDPSAVAGVLFKDGVSGTADVEAGDWIKATTTITVNFTAAGSAAIYIGRNIDVDTNIDVTSPYSDSFDGPDYDLNKCNKVIFTNLGTGPISQVVTWEGRAQSSGILRISLGFDKLGGTVNLWKNDAGEMFANAWTPNPIPEITLQLEKFPIVPGSFDVTTGEGGHFVDDELGNILNAIDASQIGTINYDTGQVTITFVEGFGGGVVVTTVFTVNYSYTFNFGARFGKILSGSKSFFGGMKAIIMEIQSEGPPLLKMLEFQQGPNVVNDAYYESSMLCTYRTGNLDFSKSSAGSEELVNKVKSLNWVYLTYYVKNILANWDEEEGVKLVQGIPRNLTLNVYRESVLLDSYLILPTVSGINSIMQKVDPLKCIGSTLSFEFQYPVIIETGSLEFGLLKMLIDFNLEGEVVGDL